MKGASVALTALWDEHVFDPFMHYALCTRMATHYSSPRLAAIRSVHAPCNMHHAPFMVTHYSSPATITV